LFKHFLESAKWIKQYNKGILVVLILRSLITSIAPLFNTIITGLLIDSLFLQKNVRHIIIVVSTMIITNLVFALINIGLNSLLSVSTLISIIKWLKQKHICVWITQWLKTLNLLIYVRISYTATIIWELFLQWSILFQAALIIFFPYLLHL